ncbi:hypothetical protein L7F22_058662 [Adiantum nelumboides]|nr:hypothetical protein [Adiantum nelumboides]
MVVGGGMANGGSEITPPTTSDRLGQRQRASQSGEEEEEEEEEAEGKAGQGRDMGEEEEETKAEGKSRAHCNGLLGKKILRTFQLFGGKQTLLVIGCIDDEFRFSRNIAISLHRRYKNVVERGISKYLVDFITDGVTAYAVGCTDEGLRSELLKLRDSPEEFVERPSTGVSTSVKLKLTTEEINECILWSMIVSITILCTPQPTVVRWSSTSPVSAEAQTKWQGFCALIANAYYICGMAWLPVKTLQLEQMAVMGHAEEPSLIADRMRIVFATLEVLISNSCTYHYCVTLEILQEASKIGATIPCTSPLVPTWKEMRFNLIEVVTTLAQERLLDHGTFLATLQGDDLSDVVNVCGDAGFALKRILYLDICGEFGVGAKWTGRPGYLVRRRLQSCHLGPTSSDVTSGHLEKALSAWRPISKCHLLEETSEEEIGEQLPPDNVAKKRGAQDFDDDASSDEELPQVFTMTEGKSLAQQLRSEERASGKRIAAEAKKKKQERAAARKSVRASRDVGMFSLDEAKAEEEYKGLANREDLLDDSIVQFLSERERADDYYSVEPSPPKELIKKKRLKSKTEQSNSRVQVVDLSRDSSFVEERSALEFKHGHLFGSRIKRDPSMLRYMAKLS